MARRLDALALAGLVLGARLAFVAGGVALVVCGPPTRTEVEPVLVQHERVPGVVAPAPADPHETVVEVVVRRVEELSAIDLVPDPLTRRVRVRAALPARVLDPSALELTALVPLRVARPPALAARARGAVSGDRLLRVTGEDTMTPLEATLRGDILQATFDLPPLGSDAQSLRLRWEGQRDGRRGAVEVEFELRARPAPRVWAGPGVAPESAVIRALLRQGFLACDGPAAADLVVANLGQPAPAELMTAVDRGKGVLLLAPAAPSLDASYERLAPVVAVAEVPPPRQGAPGDGAGRTAPAGEAAPAAGPPAPSPAAGDPGELRRTGDVAADESAAAAAARKVRKTKAVALVLLIDGSGSMSEPLAAPRIEMAKQGAVATARTLGKGDEFALVSFGSRPQVVLPLGPADRQAELVRALRELRADASATRCYPGLEESWQILKRTSAPVRHVVILTDGEFTDSLRPYDRVLQAMRAEGIGVTGLGVLGEGPLASGQFRFLKSMLDAAGGHLKTTTSSDEIPSLLLGEVEEILGAARPLDEGGGKDPAPPDEPLAKPPDEPARPAREPPRESPVEKPSAPVAHPLQPVDLEPILVGFEGVRWPAVAGYAPLEARLRARVHLAAGAAGHAYLVSAPYGLGRVAVLALGDDGWAEPLTRQEWFPRLVGQLGSWLLPPEPGGARDTTGCQRGREAILEGEGMAAEVLATVASRVDGVVERTPGRDLGSRAVTRPGDAFPWLAVLAGAYLLVLLLELVRRRARARVA